tara:strand:+ start:3259 stop:3969 length:711 start_codon:yes stop_codon:yes gene_type:complete
MSVLDYLLPKSFMSDVQTTFRPRKYDLTTDEFMPGWGESESQYYDVFQSLRDQGYEPTEEFADMLMEEVPGSWNDRITKALEIKNILDAGGEAGIESGMFLEANPSAPNIFGGQSLAEGFERSGVYDFDSAMAKPTKLSTLRGIDPGSYSKEVATKRGTLADSLSRQRAKASQIGGGFAGYGGRTVAQDLAEQQFAQGSQGIMEDVNKQRATALQQLYSELEGYGSIIANMNTPGG